MSKYVPETKRNTYLCRVPSNRNPSGVPPLWWYFSKNSIYDTDPSLFVPICLIKKIPKQFNSLPWFIATVGFLPGLTEVTVM